MGEASKFCFLSSETLRLITSSEPDQQAVLKSRSVQLWMQCVSTEDVEFGIRASLTSLRTSSLVTLAGPTVPQKSKKTTLQE